MQKTLEKLALGTALASTAFFGYYRRAYAACTLVSGSTYLCSGNAAANTATQTVNANNASVSTAAGFGVTTATGNGITISGDGAISFTDENASAITSGDSYGLFVTANADNGATPGSVSVTTGAGSAITGGGIYGIYTRSGNGATGATTLNIGGNAAGAAQGIYSLVSSGNTGGISITTSTGTVTGGNRGIRTNNVGLGATTINTSGTVTGTTTNSHGLSIRSTNASSNAGISITTASTSGISADGRGIYARHEGLGATTISTGANVTGTGTSSYGVFARALLAGNTGGISITTAATSAVSAGERGIYARNAGLGASTITTAGNVTSTYTSSRAIQAYNSNASNTGGISITTASTSAVSGILRGVYAKNAGTAATTISTSGNVTTTDVYGRAIDARNTGAGNTGGISITTAATSALSGGRRGIYADNSGLGATTISTSGNVTATTAYSRGIEARNSGANNTGGISITTASTSAVSGVAYGILSNNLGLGAANLTINGDVTSSAGKGVRAYGDASTSNMAVTIGADSLITAQQIALEANNNSTTGSTTVTVNGNVTSTANIGAYAKSNGGNVSVTQGAGSTISGNYSAISAFSHGTGSSTIVANGTMVSTAVNGIYAYNASSASGLSIATGSSSVITSDEEGIEARNLGSDSTSITVDGDITSTSSLGILAYHDSSAANITLAMGSDSIITSVQEGIRTHNNGTGSTTIAVSGDVTSSAAIGIYAYGDASTTNISVTTDDGATIAGVTGGIKAINQGIGSTSVTVGENVTSTGAGSNAIFAQNFSPTGTDITVSAAAGTVITGISNGIFALNDGTGDVTVTADGTISATTFRGIGISNSTNGGDVMLTTGSGSDIRSTNSDAISITNSGAGTTHATINGIATSTNSNGVTITTQINATDLTVTTGADSAITASGTALVAANTGTAGGTTLTVNGDVTSTTGIGAFARSSGSNLSVTQGAGSTIAGSLSAISAFGTGTGTSTIVANGTLTSATVNGIYAYNDASASSLSITTGTNSSITSANEGIEARNLGSSATSITVDGDIASTASSGIFAYHDASATNISITTGAGSVVTGAAYGILATNGGTSSNVIDIHGDVTGTTQQGVYVQAHAVDIAVQNGSDVSGATGIKVGANTEIGLLLNGASSAVSVTGTGGTAIDFGTQNDTLTLQGTVGITGNVLGDAGTDALTFNNSRVTMPSGTISGFESIGLTGNNTLNGNLSVGTLTLTSGTSSNLHLNGNITATTLTVGSGATLGGNHTLTGDLVFANGGSAAPGNSVGTQNIAGNVTFNNGSAFDVEIDGNNADRIIATGNITIDNGATLNVIPLSAFSGSIDILSAGGALTGTFGTQNLNGQSVVLTYSGTALNLTGFNNSVLGAQAGAGTGSNLLFSDTVMEQTEHYAGGRGKYLWAKGVYRYADTETRGLTLGSATRLYGLAFGGQKEVGERYKIGFALGDIASDTKVRTGAGNGDSNGVYTSFYGTYHDDGFFATLGGVAGYRQNDTERRVNNTGSFASARADYDDRDVGAIVQLGKKIPVRDLHVTPKVSADYMHTYADGFTETAGGASGVSVNDYDFGTLKTSQSLRFESQQGYAIESATADPYVEVGLAQETAVGSRRITGRFAGGAAFSNRLEDDRQNFVTFKLGSDLQLTDSINGFASYQYSHASDATRSDARVGASMKF